MICRTPQFLAQKRITYQHDQRQNDQRCKNDLNHLIGLLFFFLAVRYFFLILTHIVIALSSTITKKEQKIKPAKNNENKMNDNEENIEKWF